MILKKDTKKLYQLPEKVIFCERCTMSNQRPRITFDHKGVCSACNFSDLKKNQIDWQKREVELKALCDLHRKGDGRYDVIVPCSGGKDGSYVAHQLKTEFNMNPLCVTWSPLLPTDIGRYNLDSFIKAGFNHILGTPNPIVTRKLTQLSFNHIGDPFQPFIYGQTNFPLSISVNYKIPLIMYGENGEVEYGGDMKYAMSPTREIEDHDHHYFSGKPPSFWEDQGLSKYDLYPFQPPPFSEIKTTKTEIHFYSYYKYWDPQENYYYCREHTGLRPNPDRSEGTYSKYASLDDKLDGFHYYLSFIKFGIGRATSDSAHEIRDGKIDRDEGIALVEKYDGEFPKKYFETFLDYCDITEEIFYDVIESWRSPHIWTKKNNEWKLKCKIS